MAKRVNHAQQLEDLVAQIVRRDWHGFIAVDHAYGGTIITRLAAILWNGFVPEHGQARIMTVNQWDKN